MELWEREKGGKVCGNTAIAHASEDENVHYGEWAEELSAAWATKFKEIPLLGLYVRGLRITGEVVCVMKATAHYILSGTTVPVHVMYHWGHDHGCVIK